SPDTAWPFSSRRMSNGCNPALAAAESAITWRTTSPRPLGRSSWLAKVSSGTSKNAPRRTLAADGPASAGMAAAREPTMSNAVIRRILDVAIIDELLLGVVSSGDPRQRVGLTLARRAGEGGVSGSGLFVGDFDVDAVDNDLESLPWVFLELFELLLLLVGQELLQLGFRIFLELGELFFLLGGQLELVHNDGCQQFTGDLGDGDGPRDGRHRSRGRSRRQGHTLDGGLLAFAEHDGIHRRIRFDLLN